MLICQGTGSSGTSFAGMTKLTDECLGAVTRLLQKALGSRGLESAPANAVGGEGERESEHGFAEIPRRLYDIYMEGIGMI